MRPLDEILDEAKVNANKVLDQSKDPSVIQSSIKNDLSSMFFSGYNVDTAKKILGKLLALLAITDKN